MPSKSSSRQPLVAPAPDFQKGIKFPCQPKPQYLVPLHDQSPTSWVGTVRASYVREEPSLTAQPWARLPQRASETAATGGVSTVSTFAARRIAARKARQHAASQRPSVATATNRAMLVSRQVGAAIAFSPGIRGAASKEAGYRDEARAIDPRDVPMRRTRYDADSLSLIHI